MARLPRLNLPNIPQHVVQRGNNREVTFFCEQDYTIYLDKLKDYTKKQSKGQGKRVEFEQSGLII